MKATKRMVTAALVMATAYLVLHLLGGRGYVGMLSGTLAGGPAGMAFGVLYALSWFSTVLLVPILLLAGLAHAALVLNRNRLARWR
ncbi:hypothetical protein HPC49_04335 [Pyxidicoccus fallax]|uniref:Uncharacterized protein n=1 Tax=Pyxidicoccus fallax TaxID=394095 RepID=A0A848L981_9BACT|nr:hypothetical protein [Pyxidicoccus fallax]NMO15134.1 hypothetical protein [Pyxidicoccus fallax]NPC77480.1 hypothetical protein [Pyxidicoccus fallax]